MYILYRLSVSFAIAQSSVLAIFESRIEKKVEEYKYIPEALAAYGKVHLSELQLGRMIHIYRFLYIYVMCICVMCILIYIYIFVTNNN